MGIGRQRKGYQSTRSSRRRHGGVPNHDSSKVHQYSGACARHFCEPPHSEGPWAERNTDASVRASANAYSAALAALTAKQEKAVKDAVPTARVVELPNTSHFVFLSNEADVLREIRDFVAGLN